MIVIYFSAAIILLIMNILTNKRKIIVWDKKHIIKQLFNETVEKVDYIYGNISFKFFIRKHDYISYVIRMKHIWPDCVKLSEIWSKYNIQNYEYLIDIGANIGACSFMMLYMGIKVISFEPIKNNLHLFSMTAFNNIKYINNLTLFMIGLGNKTSVKTIYINPGNWGGSSILFKRKLKEKIDVYKLDDIKLEINSKIGMMKIDIECSELYMLQGAIKFIKDHYIKIIYFEQNCVCYQKKLVNLEEIYTILKSLKYKILNKMNCMKETLKDIIAIRD